MEKSRLARWRDAAIKLLHQPIFVFGFSISAILAFGMLVVNSAGVIEFVREYGATIVGFGASPWFAWLVLGVAILLMARGIHLVVQAEDESTARSNADALAAIDRDNAIRRQIVDEVRELVDTALQSFTADAAAAHQNSLIIARVCESGRRLAAAAPYLAKATQKSAEARSILPVAEAGEINPDVGANLWSLVQEIRSEAFAGLQIFGEDPEMMMGGPPEGEAAIRRYREILDGLQQHIANLRDKVAATQTEFWTSQKELENIKK